MKTQRLYIYLDLDTRRVSTHQTPDGVESRGGTKGGHGLPRYENGILRCLIDTALTNDVSMDRVSSTRSRGRLYGPTVRTLRGIF